MKTIITSEDKSFLNFAELSKYSGLFKYLSLRDVFVRYKQTWIGFGWSIIRPLINIVIFGSLNYLMDRKGNFADNFLLVSMGVVFWQLLSTAISDVSNSLLNNANILTKVYFPKIILPASSLLVCLVDFLPDVKNTTTVMPSTKHTNSPRKIPPEPPPEAGSL